MSPTLVSLLAERTTENITNQTNIYEISRVDSFSKVNFSAESIPDVEPNWNLYNEEKGKELDKRIPFYAEHSGPGDYPLCCGHEVENLNFFVDCRGQILVISEANTLQVDQSRT
jgi:hypothetical protein